MVVDGSGFKIGIEKLDILGLLEMLIQKEEEVYVAVYEW